ncbi:MAG: hypothetical protein KJP12_05580 [Acidimicrobiia bacterium]|nr:hypothetical protein [Acidimicrobiia bacterium]MBT8214679.1 hypothetical protein [Acidimicrobiia bacterium]NNF68774.1 hypothetical protein [Acidimicrobiia bacterium]
MILLRLLIGALIAAIAAIAIVPLFVLLDLVDGGSGWGICPDGLAICRSSYFDGPELFAVLLIVMGALAFVLHVTIVIYRKLGARAARRSIDLSGRD